MAKGMKDLTPSEREKIRKVGQIFKQKSGMTDADFQKHIRYACNRNLILQKEELDKYRIIAQVVESKNCGAGIKLGQKYVIQGIPNLLLIDESDCPLCIKALGPVSELMHGFWDRIVEGLDPNEGFWQFARCLDPGVDYGGKGSVVFKVHAQKIS